MALLFEALFYVMVAVLGRLRLLNRWFILAALVGAMAWSAILPPERFFNDLMENGQTITPEVFGLLVQAETARLLIMFLAGALLHLFREKIPASWTLVALSAGILALSMALPIPDYRLLGAVPFAYALIVSGSLIRHRRLQLHTDLSYGVYIYSFPLQQLLLIVGLSAGPLLFTAVSVVVTLPVAALSWFLVEKPSLTLKSRLERRDAPSAAPAAVGAADVPSTT